MLEVLSGDTEEWAEHRWDQKGCLQRSEWDWVAYISHGFLNLQWRQVGMHVYEKLP